jgi:hypothetical protein
MPNECELLEMMNTSILDADAWVEAANKRLTKANRFREELNALRAEADPPLPVIAPIPLLERLAPKSAREIAAKAAVEPETTVPAQEAASGPAAGARTGKRKAAPAEDNGAQLPLTEDAGRECTP